MKIHEKAQLYDDLKREVEKFIEEIEKLNTSITNIEEDSELKEAKEKDFERYYPLLAGKYSGMNFALSMKISRFKGTFNWYQRQK